MAGEQRELEGNGGLLSTVTELTRAGTFRWDLASDRLDLSERARAILGVTGTGAPTAQAVIDGAVHPEDRARAHDLRDRQRSDAAAVPAGEWQLVGPDDRVRWVAMTMAPARERPTEVLGSLLDVTERHEWQDEREFYLSALDALSRGAEPPEAASTFLAGLTGARSRTGVESPLTARETEVLELASHGGSSASIGVRLDVSTSTVKTHFEHIYAKLGVADRAGAVAEALRRGLIV